MGIIDNLENLAAERMPKVRQHQPVADVPEVAVAGHIVEPRVFVPRVIAPPPTSQPAPCPACTSPAYWQSTYNDRLWCSICDPWPSLSLVRQRWAVVVMTSEPGKPLAWERWEDGPHLELRKGLAVNCPGGRREVEAVEAVGKDGAV